MIVELAKDEFYRCTSLLDRARSIEVNAVIKGSHPGRVFVDDRFEPKTALVWLGNIGRSFLVGDEQNKSFNEGLNDLIDEHISEEIQEDFEIMGRTIKWDELAVDLFRHRSVGNWKRQVYKLHSQNYLAESEPLLPDAYQVQPLTAERLKAFDQDGAAQTKLLNFWPTLEAFEEKGVGVGVFHQGELVSFCFSTVIFERTHAVHMETKEEYRGKNLAQVAAHTYVRACFDKNVIPYWDCREEDSPSIAIAEYIGFTKVFTYTGFRFPLKASKKSSAF
ncbi:GNAT family N-acetyltransferase [Halobacillus litoralis]|uniref:GNAT family N-acetyltransferase n=1 Tax=Halobacillus litoralis TaxID=45668 RepID=UPI001CD398AC|nr:GNAT family N-acetyltransferase [Halobacillus litoralis]MCA0972000.1 GNAT family N-acetyltransferase [Halobacillus litoralis]